MKGAIAFGNKRRWWWLITWIECNGVSAIADSIHKKPISFTLKFTTPSTRTLSRKTLHLFINRELWPRKPCFKRNIIDMSKEGVYFEVRLYRFSRWVYSWIVDGKKATEVTMSTGTIQYCLGNNITSMYWVYFLILEFMIDA